MTSLQADNIQIDVHIISDHPDGSPNLNRLERIAHRILEREKWQFAIRVIITGDEELRRLNREFLSSDRVTDVIAFPPLIDEDPFAEIYVSLDQARVQALEDSESVQRAVERLMVHGILHLGGWDDDTDNKRQKMLDYGDSYLSG